MIISSENYPTILKALHCIEEDSRGPMAMRLPMIPVPAWYTNLLPAFENALSKLSQSERAPESPPLQAHVRPDAYLDSEWYEFLNGEQDSVLAIRSRSPELALASDFLNDFFEGWSHSYERGYLYKNEVSLFFPKEVA